MLPSSLCGFPPTFGMVKTDTTFFHYPLLCWVIARDMYLEESAFSEGGKRAAMKGSFLWETPNEMLVWSERKHPFLFRSEGRPSSFDQKNGVFCTVLSVGVASSKG